MYSDKKVRRHFLHACIKKPFFYMNTLEQPPPIPVLQFMHQNDSSVMYQNNTPAMYQNDTPCSFACTETTPPSNLAPKRTLCAKMYQNDVFPLRDLRTPLVSACNTVLPPAKNGHQAFLAASVLFRSTNHLVKICSPPLAFRSHSLSPQLVGIP